MMGHALSGHYSGLQKLIQDQAPHADYVHCFAHNLNLVLDDAMRHLSEKKNKRESASWDTTRRLHHLYILIMRSV